MDVEDICRAYQSFKGDHASQSRLLINGELDGKHVNFKWSSNNIQYDADDFDISSDVDSFMWQGYIPPLRHGFALSLAGNRFTNVKNKQKLPVFGPSRPKALPKRLYQIHRMPNFEFAKGGCNNDIKVYACFPGFIPVLPISKKKTNNKKKIKRVSTNLVTEIQIANFYRAVTFPALNSLLNPNELVRYPASFESAAALSKSANNFEIPSSKQLPSFEGGLEKLCDRMQTIISNSQNESAHQFKGTFFYFFCKGVKLTMESQIFCPIEKLRERYTQNINFDSFLNDNQSYIDIGLDISPKKYPSHSLIWIQRSVLELCQYQFRKPRIDSFLHSHRMGGVGAYAVSKTIPTCYYMQAYHIDKEKTHRIAGNFFGKLKPDDIGRRSAHLSQKIFELKRILKENHTRSCGVRLEWTISGPSSNSFCERLKDWVPEFINERPFVLIRTTSLTVFKTILCNCVENTASYLEKQRNPNNLEFNNVCLMLFGRLVSTVSRPPLDRQDYRLLLSTYEKSHSFEDHDQPFWKNLSIIKFMKPVVKAVQLTQSK